jgi:hypothetical protein
MVVNMGKTTFLFGFTLFTVLLWVGITLSQPNFGDDFSSVRCSRGLVVIGDYERQIANKCGIPRRETYDGPAKILVYRFSQSRFLYYFSIVDGRLERIQSGACDGDNPDCQ